MKKILFVVESPKKAGMYINTLPPFGVLYVIANLEKHGVACDLLDLNMSAPPRIDSSEYEYVAFSVNLSNITNTLEHIGEVKRRNPRAKIIVGGPSCLSKPEFFTSRDEIDAVCYGEGERAFLSYMLAGGSCGSPIPNMIMRDRENGELVAGPLEYIDDLDSLPFPALDKVDLTKYRVPIKKAAPLSGITTSRGCPYSCVFCFHSMGKKWRARSARNVVDEIAWQVETFGVKELCINDDNFSMDIARAHEICDLIEARGIKLKYQFINGVRIDRIDADLVDKFARMGVWYSVISPESGSERVLTTMKKGVTLETIESKARLFKDAGIALYGAYMIGFPFEEKEDILKTIRFAKKLDTAFAQFSIVTPLPRTELFEMAECREDDFDMEKGFFGDARCYIRGISDRELKDLVKKAYRSFYLRPRKIMELLRTLPPGALARLFYYSVITGNI